MNCDFEISEKKLEDIVFDHLSHAEYYKGLGEVFDHDNILKVLRQVDLGPYGIADIVVIYESEFDGSIPVDIIELKKGTVGKNALMQAIRYKAGIKHQFELLGIDIGHISLTLIGGSISDENNFSIIYRAIDDLYIYTYDLNSNGIVLKDECNWRFTDVNVPPSLVKELGCVDYHSKDQESRWFKHQKERYSNE